MPPRDRPDLWQCRPQLPRSPRPTRAEIGMDWRATSIPRHCQWITSAEDSSLCNVTY